MPDESATPAVLSLVILGTDAVIAAAPATPVQLAHACLAAGYGAVIPASWGDELIATECLRRVASRAREPVVCAVCPRVTDRLLATGPELAPFAVSLVSPPVATARYLRAMIGDDQVHVTYVGACPGAEDESLDERIMPHDFLADLAGRGITTLEQPQVFDSVIPPDRRRFHSLPGGVPTPEALWAAGSRTLIEIDDDDYVTDLAQRLINREHALLDIAPKLGCVCSGAVADVAPRSARIAVAAMEPPRSAMPVIDTSIPVDLVRSLPATPRHREVSLPPALELPAAASGRPMPVREPGVSPPVPRPSAPPGEPATPQPMAAIDQSGPRRRTSGSSASRAVIGAVPTVSSGEGRALPRAYVGRRRTGRTPPDNEAIRPGAPRPSSADRERPIEASIEPARAHLAAPMTTLGGRESVERIARMVRTGFERMLREPLRLAVLIGVVVVTSMLIGIFAGRRLAGTPGSVAPSAGIQPGAAPDSARALSNEIPANRTIERGGSIGPELRSSAPATTRRATPSSTPGARTRQPVPQAESGSGPIRQAAGPDTVASRQVGAPVDSAAPRAPAAAPAPVTRQDSVDRELRAIARELQLRRARIDSIARRESLRTRPPR